MTLHALALDIPARRAVELFAPRLTSGDDIARADALDAILAALEREGLVLGDVLAAGIEAFGEQSARPFASPADAGRALIASRALRTRKAAQFAGGLTVQSEPLTAAQSNWLALLLTRTGLPPMAAS